MARKDKPAEPTPPPTAVETLIRVLTEQSSNPVHLRIVKAAATTDPAIAVERELNKIMEELLHEA